MQKPPLQFGSEPRFNADGSRSGGGALLPRGVYADEVDELAALIPVNETDASLMGLELASSDEQYLLDERQRRMTANHSRPPSCTNRSRGR